MPVSSAASALPEALSKPSEVRGGRYIIDPARCDVCGDCYIVCPADAVEVVAG